MFNYKRIKDFSKILQILVLLIINVWSCFAMAIELEHGDIGFRDFSSWKVKGGIGHILGNDLYLYFEEISAGNVTDSFDNELEFKLNISSDSMYASYDSLGDIFWLYFELQYSINLDPREIRKIDKYIGFSNRSYARIMGNLKIDFFEEDGFSRHFSVQKQLSNLHLFLDTRKTYERREGDKPIAGLSSIMAERVAKGLFDDNPEALAKMLKESHDRSEKETKARNERIESRVSKLLDSESYILEDKKSGAYIKFKLLRHKPATGAPLPIYSD